MELEELKQNWNIMEERLGRLEMDQRQQLNNKVVSKVKKVQDRVLRRFTIVVICLPFFFAGILFIIRCVILACQRGYCCFCLWL